MTSATILMVTSSSFQLESSLRAEMSGGEVCADAVFAISIATRMIAARMFLLRSPSSGYRPWMPEADKLTPADPRDLADAIGYALRFRGRKRVHNADEYMAAIAAERVVEYLERAGFVVMKRPRLSAARRWGGAMKDSTSAGRSPDARHVSVGWCRGNLGRKSLRPRRAPRRDRLAACQHGERTRK